MIVRAEVVAVLTALLVVAVTGTAGEGPGPEVRTEQAEYVATMLGGDECPGPGQTVPAQVLEGLGAGSPFAACFEVLPGESEVFIQAVDRLTEHGPSVWYSFPEVKESGYFCGAAVLEIPEDARALTVKVTSLGVAPECPLLDGGGTEGVVEAAFS